MNNKALYGGKDTVTGTVFHIIHGSFVDGYGIRTTVFLKGCPLRCVWCCNPEGQLAEPEIKLTADVCDSCGRCLEVCPVEAIRLEAASPREKIRIDRRLCNNCGKCLEVCYTGALDFFGKSMTVDELFDILKKDEQFYRSSGGGVTIGGGEPTFQPLFTLALLRKCRENYIHTAVDTCGYVLRPEGMKILEEADLLLFDLKGIDEEAHVKNTGVSNAVILKNLTRLDGMGKEIIIRVPLIPGHTDSPENIEATAAFISGLKSVVRVDLLAFHEYGGIKYRQLGREIGLPDGKISEERLNEIRLVFESYGLNVQLGG